MQTLDIDNYELMTMAPGFRVGFPIHSATGSASTATVLFELDPGAELGVHTDSAEELLIILQGTAEARIGDESGRHIRQASSDAACRGQRADTGV